MSGDLVERFRSARSESKVAVVEGFHAVKHAIRFGAQPIELVGLDKTEIVHMAQALAPDIVDPLRANVVEVEDDVFARLAPKPPPTGLVGLFARPSHSAARIFADPAVAPVVLIERPTRLGNVGAAIRVAAAAGVAGVVTTGEHDPWHPEAIRGAAGLHFALPVAGVEELPAPGRPIVALDPGGEPMSRPFPERALLAFGSERSGLSEALLARSSEIVSIPMRPGVSSLNLAISVAIVLYARVLPR